MKYAFYQGAAPGMTGLAKRLSAGALGGQAAEQKGFLDAAHADAYGAQADLARAKADQEGQQSDALRDEAGWISRLSGAPMPQAQQIADFRRTGNFGRIAPLTPNDDEGNAMPAATITQAPADVAPYMDKAALAQRLQQVALASGGGNPHQLAQAAGEFQGQNITDAVQAAIAKAGLSGVDLASTMNQGGKLGHKIDRFSTGTGGLVLNDASGTVDANNPVAQSVVVKNLNAGEGAKVPTGYRPKPDGTLEAIPGGPADVRSGEAANRIKAREAEQAAREAERRTQGLERQVTHFSEQMQKTNIPAFDSILQDVKNELAKYEGKDVPGVGATGNLPAFLLSDEGKALRQKIATLRNIELKDRSGAAVTDNELRRYLEELGTGWFSTDKQLLDAIKNIEARFTAVKQNAAAGVNDEVLGEYRNRGGMALERGPTAPPLAPRAAPGAPQAPSAPVKPNNKAPAAIPEGTRDKSNSGRPIIMRGGKWVYDEGAA